MLAMLGFVGITVVSVKFGRRNTDKIIRSVPDVTEKYVVVAVLRELAVGAMKQIAGFVEVSMYLSVGL